MSTSTIVNNTTTDRTTQEHPPRWQTVLMWVVVLALFIVAITMRLYNLGLPFDRDGYDEGVYWQSLLAMNAGHSLYQQIFYSQPPFFLLSLFPSFVLFGSTLWSARLSIALLSLFGLPGAFLLGKVLSGRLGAVAALLLLVANPFYLQESQTVQAEASTVAFSILAVGLAYLWWEHPEGILGLCLAALTGIALSLSILCKLLGVVSLVPVGLLMLARLWQIWQKQPGTSLASLRPIFAGVAICIVTMLLVLLPFLGSYHAMFQEVITFHIQSASAFNRAPNSQLIRQVLLSVLGLTALYGILAAFLRRDWRVIALVAWLLATAFMLWRQVPLLPHHLIILIPPLIALTVMGIGRPLMSTSMNRMSGWLTPSLVKWITPVAILLVLVTTVLDIQRDGSYYNTAAIRSVDKMAQLEMRIAADLQHAITPDQLVVSDDQFVVGLANRHTPPSLVDTSMVRINTGSLTLQQLIDVASEPQVHAVLFLSSRFYLPKVAPFHAWVAHHFHLLRAYGPGLELWVR